MKTIPETMKTEADDPAGGRQGRNYTPLLGELRPAGGLLTQERSQGASPLRLLRSLSPNTICVTTGDTN